MAPTGPHSALWVSLSGLGFFFIPKECLITFVSKIFRFDELWGWPPGLPQVPPPPETPGFRVWLWMYFCHPCNVTDNFCWWNFLIRWNLNLTPRAHLSGPSSPPPPPIYPYLEGSEVFPQKVRNVRPPVLPMIRTWNQPIVLKHLDFLRKNHQKTTSENCAEG